MILSREAQTKRQQNLQTWKLSTENFLSLEGFTKNKTLSRNKTFVPQKSSGPGRLSMQGIQVNDLLVIVCAMNDQIHALARKMHHMSC